MPSESRPGHIRVVCSHCGQVSFVSASAAGSVIKCACGASLAVPIDTEVNMPDESPVLLNPSDRPKRRETVPWWVPIVLLVVLGLLTLGGVIRWAVDHFSYQEHERHKRVIARIPPDFRRYPIVEAELVDVYLHHDRFMEKVVQLPWAYVAVPARSNRDGGVSFSVEVPPDNYLQVNFLGNDQMVDQVYNSARTGEQMRLFGVVHPADHNTFVAFYVEF